VYIAIGGPQTALLTNKGIVAVQGEQREVTSNDVDRVIAAAQVL
ncbi:MAG TPA: cell division protein FtsA, partial [Firmicutes bacterium]|nr:cell division protein FtsA [Bacillota bacterium]